MVIVCKRNDVEDRNDWNNYTKLGCGRYTSLFFRFENPYYNKYERNFVKGGVNYLSTVNKIAWEKVNDKNYELKKDKNCLRNISLNLDGTDRDFPATRP